MTRGKEIVAWVFVAFVYIAADAVLWWLSGSADAGARAAFIGAASAWGVAGISLATGVLAARRAHHYSVKLSLYNERRAAYANVIAVIDRGFDAVQAKCREEDDQRIAAKQLQHKWGDVIAGYDGKQLPGDLVDEKSKVDKLVVEADARLKEAVGGLMALVNEFISAQSVALLVASPSVSRQLDRIVDVIKGENTRSMAEVRQAFLTAAKQDLSP